MTRTTCYLATALLACASHAFAQDFPTRFVTIVAPFQAGGPSDTVARLTDTAARELTATAAEVKSCSGRPHTMKESTSSVATISSRSPRRVIPATSRR